MSKLFVERGLGVCESVGRQSSGQIAYRDVEAKTTNDGSSRHETCFWR